MKKRQRLNNPLNQYTQFNTKPIDYDPNGNMTRFDNKTFLHNAENRLTEIEGTATYRYDPYGRRIAKAIGSPQSSVHSPQKGSPQTADHSP